MRGWAYVWRRQLKRWLPALCVLVVAVALAMLYRLAFAGEAEFRQQGFQERSADLLELRRQRESLESFAAQVQTSQADVDSFLGDRLSTEEQQLTKLIASVRTDTRRAGLVPSVINYQRQEVERQRLLKRSIVFTVEGDYFSFRKLLNSLELSQSFLTLEEVSLSGAEGGTLRINLRLATYFREEPAAAAGGGAP